MQKNKITIKDIISWDVVNWSLAIRFWEKHLPADLKNFKVLEIGSTLGGLSLWAASKQAEVLCSDLENPEQLAQPYHQHFDYPGSISYKAIDATVIPYENHFDIIMFKSVLGGVGRDGHPERQQKMIDEIYKALKPDGYLLFAENLRASRLHQFARRKFVRWGSYWRYITVDEMQEYCKGKFHLSVKTTGFLGTFGRSELQRKILSSLDVALFNRITLARSRYILCGVALKLTEKDISKS